MSNKTIVNYPKVSIITCVYNGEKYLSKLLESVLNMEYPNIEHIIVNDGSTDSTDTLIKDYIKIYESKENSSLHIKYLKQKNMGLGGATNTGLNNITGEFWTWINCDDWYEKYAFFEPIRMLMEKPKLDYVQMNGFYKGKKNNGDLIVNPSSKMNFNSGKKLYKQYCYNNSDFRYLLFICKTQSYKKICPTMHIYPSKYTQDDQFIVQLFALTKGEFCRKPTWNFLQRNDSFLHIGAEGHINDMDNIVKGSVELLNVSPRVKNALYALFYEHNYVENLKHYALIHKPLGMLRYFFQKRTYRKKISIRFFNCFNHMTFLYFIYSLLFFL